MWLLFLKVRRPNALRSFIERRVNHTRMQRQSNCNGILIFRLIPRLSMHFIPKQLYYCRRRLRRRSCGCYELTAATVKVMPLCVCHTFTIFTSQV